MAKRTRTNTEAGSRRDAAARQRGRGDNAIYDRPGDYDLEHEGDDVYRIKASGTLRKSELDAVQGSVARALARGKVRLLIVLEEFALRSAEDWRSRLERAEVPHAPVVPIDEGVLSPQTGARQMVQEVTDATGLTYRLLSSPIHWNDLPSLPVSPPPRLGEHTEEVLRDWLGFGPEHLAALRATGALG